MSTATLLVVTGYTGCDRVLTVAVMFAALACTCVSFTVVGVNQLDLAPLHAGKIMGLTYAVANLASIAAPHAVAILTYHRCVLLRRSALMVP